MTAAEREAIVAAARQHAAQSAQAQGLNSTIRDPDTLAAIAALLVHADAKSAAA